MPEYTTPGVYIEEQTMSATPIRAAGTSTAAFVGVTAIDDLPVSPEVTERKTTATLITSWRDYETLYGGIKPVYPSHLTITDPGYLNVPNILPKNDGTNDGTCDITVVTGQNLIEDTEYSFDIATHTISVSMASGSTPVAVAEAIKTAIDTAISGAIIPPIQVSRTSATITLTNPTSSDISMSNVNVISGDTGPDYMGHSVQAFFYNGGGRAYIYHVDDFTNLSAAMTALELHRDISLLITPGETNPTADPNVVSHLNKMGNRLWLTYLDEDTSVIDAANTVPDQSREFSYQALYYPWVEVSNPDYDPDLVGAMPTYFIPPVGFVAGNFARIDQQRGFWKSPAGLETSILGGLRTKTPLSDALQGELNPVHVNCIRKFGSSFKIWGGRTLHSGQWRYVSVRRTAMMIEESIYNGIQWAVFEPNDSNLWASLRQTIETFMSGLHTAGAFMGDKASDAFFVRCGLNSTMTQDDIDQGRVIVEVGFAPVNPAEFVVVRISQKLQSQS